jgi:hypothetical protein
MERGNDFSSQESGDFPELFWGGSAHPLTGWSTVYGIDVDLVGGKASDMLFESLKLFFGVVDALDDEDLKPDGSGKILSQEKETSQMFLKAQGGVGPVEALEGFFAPGIERGDDEVDSLNLGEKFLVLGKERAVRYEDYAFFREEFFRGAGNLPEMEMQSRLTPSGKGDAGRRIPPKAPGCLLEGFDHPIGGQVFLPFVDQV